MDDKSLYATLLGLTPPWGVEKVELRLEEGEVQSLRPQLEPRARSSPRSLSAEEHQAVIQVLHEPRFIDLAPAEVYAALLDEERYLCSVRTQRTTFGVPREMAPRPASLMSVT